MTALAAAMLVYFGYIFIYNRFFPPPPPSQATTAGNVNQSPQTSGMESSPAGSAPATTSAPVERFNFHTTSAPVQVTLGGQADDRLRVILNSHGASVESIRLTQQERGKYAFKTAPKQNEPYLLVAPVETPDGDVYSFVTPRVWIRQFPDSALTIGQLNWSLQPGAPEEAMNRRDASFETQLIGQTSGARLIMTKRYRLEGALPQFMLEVSVKNAGGQALDVAVQQNGPVGVHSEDARYQIRRVMAASRDPQGVPVLGKPHQRSDLKRVDSVRLDKADANHVFLWTALVNKYFGVFTRPVPVGDQPLPKFREVRGTLAARSIEGDIGDELAELQTDYVALAPGQEMTWAFDVYCGPKDPDYLSKINPAFGDRKQIGLSLAQDAEISSCSCTFHPLPEIMSWLLRTVRQIVGNYGIAIFILVLIVRSLLHPLAVFQQKSMYKMQEAMARIQPRMEALKQQFANDKVRLNQEMMKMYAEENVNPAASFVGMLPLLLQMPILVALWNALNNDIYLRHAPFDGWWIKDLSAPDALIQFSTPIAIPVLSWLPLVGTMFTNIPAINLLPILMGVSMWLQQKYMPKPNTQAKLDAAKHAAAQRKPGEKTGPTLEDQLRQQRIMANIMSFLFPIMFYYMPSGLNLYWMASNVFGIFESLRIRKQIQAEKARRELEGPKVVTPRKPGLVARALKKVAAQAEELQKKADELAQQEKAGKGAKQKRGRANP